MIKCYFGVPGVGKSTVLVKEARRGLRKKYITIKGLRKRYDKIYTINIDIKDCERITFKDLEKYKFTNSLILIDEITMDADNRNFKSFTEEARDFFILHRHLGCDIIYATQNFENVDKKIRDLTSELWYMSKTIIPILDSFTTARRIYRNININEFTSELSLGYRFCSLLELIFASNIKTIWRRRYYKYFDTNEELSIKGRPKYQSREEIKNEIQTKTNNILYKLNHLQDNQFSNKDDNTNISIINNL